MFLFLLYNRQPDFGVAGLKKSNSNTANYWHCLCLLISCVSPTRSWRALCQSSLTRWQPSWITAVMMAPDSSNISLHVFLLKTISLQNQQGCMWSLISQILVPQYQYTWLCLCACLYVCVCVCVCFMCVCLCLCALCMLVYVCVPVCAVSVCVYKCVSASTHCHRTHREVREQPEMSVLTSLCERQGAFWLLYLPI